MPCGTRFLLAAALVTAVVACKGSDSAPTPPPRVVADGAPRSWMMGFGYMPPRMTTEDVIRGIDSWSPRAELAIIHEDVPWKELLGGEPAAQVVERKFGKLVDYMRGKGLKLVFVADVTDGLGREKEAGALRELKRSLAEPAVQQAHRDYVVAVVRRLRPDYLGLAAETNLVREIAPPVVYRAVVQAANSAAKAARGAGHAGPLLVSVQVETAWGLMPKGAFRGIERDLADFPFADMLGLSSYPYFAFDDPARIPADYYSRVLAGRRLPTLVTEGGWASASVAHLRGTPEAQARYVRRHAELLDGIGAVAVLQLLYADVDLSGWPRGTPELLRLFASIGLADTRFRPKPALAEWDRLHARPLRPEAAAARH